MDLRKSHSQRFLFDLFLVAVAVFGLLVAWFSFNAGGIWDIVGLAALLGESLLVWGSFFELHRVTVARYREKLTPDAQVWIKIAFLTDLHAGEFHTKQCYERIASEVQALHPDVIFLGGDYVADLYEPIADLVSLKELQAPLGKFFVLGNHDYPDKPQEIRRMLSDFGYADLTNKTIELKVQGRELEVRGVDDHWMGKPETFRRSFSNLPHITLSHEPDILLDLKEGDTDLVLAGHTHSGQVRLPLVGALVPLPTKLGRAMDRGRKVMHGIPCIISNGLGETDGRLRPFSPPQIVIVEVGI